MTNEERVVFNELRHAVDDLREILKLVRERDRLKGVRMVVLSGYDDQLAKSGTAVLKSNAMMDRAWAEQPLSCAVSEPSRKNLSAGAR
jgi:hypothetical protein